MLQDPNSPLTGNQKILTFPRGKAVTQCRRLYTSLPPPPVTEPWRQPPSALAVQPLLQPGALPRPLACGGSLGRAQGLSGRGAWLTRRRHTTAHAFVRRISALLFLNLPLLPTVAFKSKPWPPLGVPVCQAHQPAESPPCTSGGFARSVPELAPMRACWAFRGQL